ncbi:MAG: VWA domain-containing protein [Bacteroidetes bacterium]|nr:VWA domain-containing protein [Bacteroidota bacterium]
MIEAPLFFGFSFLHPWVLWFLLLVPVIAWLLYRTEVKTQFKAYTTHSAENLKDFSESWPKKLKVSLTILKSLALFFFVLALAGPYKWGTQENVEDYKKGIDIVLAMDVSLSMFARDFKPNRLEASKRVAKDFINGRNGDRIGLVVYAGEAYTACPSTLNYDVLIQQLDQLSGEYIDGGTAIGVGLGTAVTRLRSDSLTSKVIILLTDGSNNAGEITPEIAAELALAKNIRVYTIGVGTNGEALSPVVTPFGIRFENIPVEIDESTLIQIANKTGGKYFRATDEEKLSGIYKEIELIEKQKFLNEVFQEDPPADPTLFILLGFSILLLASFIDRVIFKRGHA